MRNVIRILPALALLALCGCGLKFYAPVSPVNVLQNDPGILQKVWNVQGGMPGTIPAK